MKTAVSTRGQIVISLEIRQQDAIEPGQEFEIERIGCREYRLARSSPPPNQGLLEWLLACPEKGFFVPIELNGASRE
jgi:bifunctional DNA-binding transcriptional regulator/antitoxin component of YhaV-PrlF toxin-antitoxin module